MRCARGGHSRPGAGPGQAIAGQSHAWVEYWAGDWVPADPTNQAPVGEGHLVVARGPGCTDPAAPTRLH
ncbi:MAG: hypothetical protein ACRDND_02695 [Streptosporangiaceae bacterium]